MFKSRSSSKRVRGTGGLYNLLSTAYAAAPDVLPDLIVLDQHDLQKAIDGGYVQALEETLLQKTDFFPFAQTEITTTYGIPFVALADHTVYRTGISATPPFSWTDVVTKGYSLLFPAAPADELADDALLAAYIGAGGDIIDEDGNAKLDRAVLEQLYGFIADMMAFNLINPDRVLLLARRNRELGNVPTGHRQSECRPCRMCIGRNRPRAACPDGCQRRTAIPSRSPTRGR